MKQKAKKKARVVAIDLFCGAGGMSLGATQAGIEVLFAAERCPVAAETYRQNFPDTDVHQGDVQDIRSLPTKPRAAQTIVFGGPPCQGFSTSNQRTRSYANPDNWMYLELLRVARLWEPDWIVIENVKGIKETLKAFFLQRITDRLMSEGYTAHVMNLNAANYGVPQRRERTFVVAAKGDRSMVEPPRYAGPSINTGAAIRDLPKLAVGASVDKLPYGSDADNDYAKSLRKGQDFVTGNLVTRNAAHVVARYPHVPQGGNWEDIPSDKMANYGDTSKCHTGIYRRLHPEEPSVVIGNFRKNMLIHPYQDRGLSVREAARIQSVPDDFRFCGSIGFQQQQVGNMVPPPLAKAVFTELVRA